MATLAHGGYTCKARERANFGPAYFAMLILSLHWAIVTYVNSTYLSQYVSSETIGALYAIGASLTIVGFLFISRILRRLGNYQLSIGLAVAEMGVLLGLAFADSMRFVIPLFVLHNAIVPLLLFNLDVYVEEHIGTNERQTGSRRGLLLSIMNLAGAVAPLAAGFLIGDGSPRYFLVYLTSALLMLLFFHIIVSNFKRFCDPRYDDIEVLSAIRRFWVHPNLRFVFLAHFLLQLFFAWMVIYMPLYMATVIGFGWSEIGVILFFALMAYVFLEYPIGEAADRYIGEKEMMAVGFLIMAVSTGWISFLHTAALIPWMITLFLTRVGASLVETTTESYFFKHTEASDANVISLFRVTRPLAYLLGALIGSLSLLYLPLSGIFFVLGLLLLPGIVLALLLEDTR